MVDGFLFDKLAKIASIMKAKSKTSAAHQPFGGIQVGTGAIWTIRAVQLTGSGLQLVVTGDFFQLPPVVKGSSEPSFAFDAQNWSKVIDHTVLLTQVFRQKDTSTSPLTHIHRHFLIAKWLVFSAFIDMLNELRLGTASDQTIAAFRRLKEERNYTDGMEPTELYVMKCRLASHCIGAPQTDPHWLASLFVMRYKGPIRRAWTIYLEKKTFSSQTTGPQAPKNGRKMPT